VVVEVERVLSADLQRGGERAGAAGGLMPPYLVLRDFLDEAAAAGLLEHAITRQAQFTPTGVGSSPDGASVDPSIRVSTGLRTLGAFRPMLKAKILGLLPTLVDQLGVKPPEDARLETQLVAHGDGAFYRRHIDTATALYRERDRIRILSGVYYFHAEPKAFTGGALRLHAIGGGVGANFIDLEPARNSLLVFLSWAPHEVMPVTCPSKAFADSRFAINCWIHDKKPAS
jgi:predicted 2-oxoglutarate/Fe(II)-dependent dioxygenase YbiX